MRAYLKGGPANGRVIEHMPEGMRIYQVPIPRQLTIQDCLQQSMNPMDPGPNYDVADYAFTGLATVDIRGRLGCVIYEYAGTGV